MSKGEGKGTGNWRKNERDSPFSLSLFSSLPLHSPPISVCVCYRLPLAVTQQCFLKSQLLISCLYFIHVILNLRALTCVAIRQHKTRQWKSTLSERSCTTSLSGLVGTLPSIKVNLYSGKNCFANFSILLYTIVFFIVKRYLQWLSIKVFWDEIPIDNSATTLREIKPANFRFALPAGMLFSKRDESRLLEHAVTRPG